MDPISFQLCEIRPDGHVTGRNCGGDMPVGVTFTAVSRVVFPPKEPDEPLITPPAEFVATIALRLDTAEAYQHRLDIVYSGMTALLGLSGTGLDVLSDLIDQAPPSTYYSLVAPDALYSNTRNA